MYIINLLFNQKNLYIHPHIYKYIFTIMILDHDFNLTIQIIKNWQNFTNYKHFN